MFVGGHGLRRFAQSLPAIAQRQVPIGLARRVQGHLPRQLRHPLLQVVFHEDLGQRAVHGVGQHRRVIGHHFAAVILGFADVLFGKRGQQVAGRRAARDQVIGHDHVDHVFGAALGHVAADAILAGRMRAFGDFAIERGLVALQADGGIGADGLRAARNGVRIVAGVAGERAFALAEAARHAQPVGGAADDFKLLVVPGAGGVVEGEHEILQRLAGAEGEGAAVEAADDCGKRGAGGLQVALHAQVHAQFRAEAGGIDDAGANLLAGGAGGLDGAQVLGAGAVAALAIDAFGQIAGKDGLAIGRRRWPGGMRG